MKKIMPIFLLNAGSLLGGDVAAPAQGNNLTQTVMLLGFGAVFFYFLLWRPERKRRKALEQQRNSLKKGDKVTTAGIIGTVARIQENTVILKMFDGSKIEVLKAAISDVQQGNEEIEAVQVVVEEGETK